MGSCSPPEGDPCVLQSWEGYSCEQHGQTVCTRVHACAKRVDVLSVHMCD